MTAFAERVIGGYSVDWPTHPGAHDLPVRSTSEDADGVNPELW
jgi:hypothetical protein